MSSGWFDCTEPSLSTSLQGKQSVQGAYALVRGGLKHIEPHRTYSNENITEITRCGEACHMSLVWFDCTESSLSTSLQGKQSVQVAYALVRGGLKHIEPHRTYSNHNITEIANCGEVCHMSSGWFDCTEPSPSTSLQGKQGVQGSYTLVRGGSSTSNFLAPTLTTPPQR